MTCRPARTVTSRTRRFVESTALVLLLLVVSATAGSADATLRPPPAPTTARLLIPAYAHPSGTTWQKLCSTLHARGQQAVLVMNPDNGPGRTVDPAYRRAVSSCQQRSFQTVIGYVATSYGQRPHRAVVADVERYARLYPGLRGIFLDEMSSDASTKPYYLGIRDAVRARAPRALVVGNPGAAASTSWQVDAPAVADVLVLFEGHALDYLRWAPPAWTKDPRQHRRFAHLVHSVPARLPSGRVCAAWRTHPSGFIYVTQDVMPNPWDRLSLDVATHSCLS